MVSFTTAPLLYSLKVKANYPGSNSSIDAESKLTKGKVAPGIITPVLIDPVIGKIQVSIDPVLHASSYNWYKNGVQVIGQHGVGAQIPISKVLCDVGYAIEVEAVNACGTSAKSYKGVFVPCEEEFFMMSPNPASDEVTISSKQLSSSNPKKTFSEVRIYDLSGNLKKFRKYNKVNSGSINISDLQNGNYSVEIIEGGKIEKKQLLIQR